MYIEEEKEAEVQIKKFRMVVVNAGDTEVWVFDKSKGDEPHPMHLHGVQFRVIGGTGQRGVQAHKRGWKDTVLVAPGEVVRI